MSDLLFDGKRFRILTLVDNYIRKCHALKVGQSLKGLDIVWNLFQNTLIDELVNIISNWIIYDQDVMRAIRSLNHSTEVSGISI
jgi:hypothetical protein